MTKTLLSLGFELTTFSLEVELATSTPRNLCNSNVKKTQRLLTLSLFLSYFQGKSHQLRIEILHKILIFMYDMKTP